MAFGNASVVPDAPLMSIVKTWLKPPCRMAAANSRAGSAMCCGFSPGPYSTAGTKPARRVRRAPPLPNSVRGSALIFTSDTGKLLKLFDRAASKSAGVGGAVGDSAVPGEEALGTSPEHRVDHGASTRTANVSNPRSTLAVATVPAYLLRPRLTHRVLIARALCQNFTRRCNLQR